MGLPSTHSDLCLGKAGAPRAMCPRLGSVSPPWSQRGCRQEGHSLPPLLCSRWVLFPPRFFFFFTPRLPLSNPATALQFFPAFRGSKHHRLFLVKADQKAITLSREGSGLRRRASPNASGSRPGSGAQCSSACSFSWGMLRPCKNHFHLNKK